VRRHLHRNPASPSGRRGIESRITQFCLAAGG
jgi:hypothetical protein